MRDLSCLLTIVLVAALVAAQTDRRPATELGTVAHLFDYDAKQPLDIHDKVIEEFNGGTLHDITYTSPKGGPVGAYLVVPGRNSFPKPSFTQELVRFRLSLTTRGIGRNLGIRHRTISTNQDWIAKSKFRLCWIFAAESTCCWHARKSIRSGSPTSATATAHSGDRFCPRSTDV